MRLKIILTILGALTLPIAVSSENTITPTVEVSRFAVPEARQAVAVDEDYFYAIANQKIGKYDKASGALIGHWQATEALPLVHLNSGVVINGELFCAHSNFPQYPEVSSIEVWNTTNLEHVRSHSLGICDGSITWVDWHDGAWWAAFAHYSKKVNDNPHSKDVAWTSLVRFDKQWRRTAGWVFPPEVVAKFEPHSCSGGSWGPHGLLYCTGHDRGELYAMQLPEAGSTLKLLKTFEVSFTGQGFAWDRNMDGTAYGIDRAKGEVIVNKIPVSKELTHKMTKKKSVGRNR